MTSEDQIDNEIEQADLIKEEVHLALTRLDKALRKVAASTATSTLPPTTTAPVISHAAVKLPKLTLHQFDGDLVN